MVLSHLIHRGPFSDWVRKRNGRTSRVKGERNVRRVTLVGLRDKQFSELACRANNDSVSPNLEMEPLVWSEELGEPIGFLRTKRHIDPGEELCWNYDYTEEMLQRMQLSRQPDDYPVVGLKTSVKNHFEARGVFFKCKYCNKCINVAGANKSAVHWPLKAHLGLVKNFAAGRDALNSERKAKQKAKRKVEKSKLVSEPKRYKKPTRKSTRLLSHKG